MTATIEQLAARVFSARDVAHRAHWRTGSYSAHMALGAFYDGAIEAVDAVVECYQGRFGLIGAFDVSTEAVPDVAAYLADEAEWLQSARDEIAAGSTPVQNLIDALIEIYLTTVYKLRSLI